MLRSVYPAQETPPRMWGELHLSQAPQMQVRNTPTYVGRTYCLLKVLCCRWKHPHVCGENYLFGSFFNFLYETPPRMWGEHSKWKRRLKMNRNTPTYVGRTGGRLLSELLAQKHPHVCGENLCLYKNSQFVVETPPRMWGELKTTEKTYRTSGKHPHVCGENTNKVLYIKGSKTLRFHFSFIFATFYLYVAHSQTVQLIPITILAHTRSDA